MRTGLALLLGVFLTLPLLSGCGPALSEEDLGTVVFDVPEVPGADEPYPFPDSDAEPEPDSPDESTDGNS
jgi:hypothetical protein